MAHSSWGPGYPNCQYNRISRNFYVDTKWGRVTFPGGVRYEITELVSRLVKETSNRGYRFGVPGNASYGCWGFSCRAIRGSSKPSNHSWGLAVDINAPKNPMGDRLITDMPGWMPDLWNAYGFRWGGDYVSRPDAMHYEFMGSVADAARLTEVARKNRLGDIRTAPKPPTTPTPTPTPPRKVRKMYFLMKGANGDAWFLTDMLHKRHMKSRDEANFHIYVIRANGGTVIDNKGLPQVWPQPYVDRIPLAS